MGLQLSLGQNCLWLISWLEVKKLLLSVEVLHVPPCMVYLVTRVCVFFLHLPLEKETHDFDSGFLLPPPQLTRWRGFWRINGGTIFSRTSIAVLSGISSAVLLSAKSLEPRSIAWETEDEDHEEAQHGDRSQLSGDKLNRNYILY